jgi:hypothetical protein
MATKTTIQNLIDTNLASGSNITATEHRAVLNTILNELFPTSDTYIVATGDVQYNLTFTKVGNKCTLSGSIANSANSIIGGVKLFDIPNSIYFPKKLVFLFGQTQFTSQNTSLVISDGSFIFPNSFYLDGALPAFSILEINITYIVND